jgi:hypothetical protein
MQGCPNARCFRPEGGCPDYSSGRPEHQFTLVFDSFPTTPISSQSDI